MSPEKKVLWGAVAGVAVVVLLLFSSEKVEQEVMPRPRAAWVAVEVAASGLARTGRVEIASGTPFRLHAVLEAESWTGKTIYFTEAERLEIEGEEVPAGSLRRWQREIDPRILWFTVEGFTPFLEVTDAGSLDQFRFQELFWPDWPRAWSIPGDLQTRSEVALKQPVLNDLPRFGTQRYHVRFEIFGPESEIAPRSRIQSLRAADLPEKADSFTTVVARLPGNLALPSGVFGLTQIEPSEEMLGSVAGVLQTWLNQGIAFSRWTVLRDYLRRSGVDYRDLRWVGIDVAEGSMWGEEGVQEGDLLRVGDRWVVLLGDRGSDHVLDREDLCFDFDRGARVQRLGDVFTGDGLVYWADLPEPSGASGAETTDA